MRKALFAAAVALILAALVLVPMPFVALTPGGALPVAERIQVGADDQELNGELLLTTVRIGEPSALGLLDVWLDDAQEIVERQQFVPPDVDRRQFRRQQIRIFEESATVAAAVAQRAAGLDVTVTGDGALVVGILPGSPAEDELEPGDVIVEVSGQPVELANDVGLAIATREAGDVIELVVERDNEELAIDVELEDIGELGQAGIGVALQTLNQQIDVPIDVELVAGGIGGPSAGLMLALTIYDLIVDEDVTEGRVIAGTGTIDADGRVGPVGGVEQKVVAAERAGASIFLVPPEEAEEALADAAPGLQVIVVETFDEALEALRAPT
jgi:PDZ domain-containing protein